jgi:hypothetical protein
MKAVPELDDLIPALLPIKHRTASTDLFGALGNQLRGTIE